MHPPLRLHNLLARAAVEAGIHGITLRVTRPQNVQAAIHRRRTYFAVHFRSDDFDRCVNQLSLRIGVNDVDVDRRFPGAAVVGRIGHRLPVRIPTRKRRPNNAGRGQIMLGQSAV